MEGPTAGSELLGGSAPPALVRVGRLDAAFRRRLWRWGLAVAVVVFAAVQATTVWQLRRDAAAVRTTRADADTSARDLDRAEIRLERTRRELAAATDELAETRSRLAGLQDDLGTRSAERDQLVASLATTVDDLAGTRAELGTTEQRLAGQLEEVEALRGCLTGVSQALTLVTFDDEVRALATLDAVEASCASAEASLAYRRSG